MDYSKIKNPDMIYNWIWATEKGFDTPADWHYNIRHRLGSRDPEVAQKAAAQDKIFDENIERARREREAREAETAAKEEAAGIVDADPITADSVTTPTDAVSADTTPAVLPNLDQSPEAAPDTTKTNLPAKIPRITAGLRAAEAEGSLPAVFDVLDNIVESLQLTAAVIVKIDDATEVVERAATRVPLPMVDEIGPVPSSPPEQYRVAYKPDIIDIPSDSSQTPEESEAKAKRAKKRSSNTPRKPRKKRVKSTPETDVPEEGVESSSAPEEPSQAEPKQASTRRRRTKKKQDAEPVQQEGRAVALRDYLPSTYMIDPADIFDSPASESSQKKKAERKRKKSVATDATPVKEKKPKAINPELEEGDEDTDRWRPTTKHKYGLIGSIAEHYSDQLGYKVWDTFFGNKDGRKKSKGGKSGRGTATNGTATKPTTVLAAVTNLDNGVKRLQEQVSKLFKIKSSDGTSRSLGAKSPDADKTQADDGDQPWRPTTKHKYGLFGSIGERLMGKVGQKIVKSAPRVAAAAGRGIVSMVKLLANPTALLIAAAAAIGTAIYKYFTDDDFAKSVNDVITGAFAKAKEWFIDPIMGLFRSFKNGVLGVYASIFEAVGSISIPIPSLLQKIGLPADVKPFGFLAEAATNIRSHIADSESSSKQEKKVTAPAEKPPAALAGAGRGTSPGAGAGRGAPPTIPAPPSSASARQVAAPRMVGTNTASVAPVDSGPAIVRVVEVGAGYNVVELNDGSVVRREGPWNWRNNNPGNMEYNSFTRGLGALPMPEGASKSHARYAIFPTYEMGRAAKARLLFQGKYKDLTVSEAIARWAPASENPTAAYQKTVLAAIGGQDVKLSTLSADQQQSMLNAMQKVEGFKPGRVTVVRAANREASSSGAVPSSNAPPSAQAPAATPSTTVAAASVPVSSSPGGLAKPTAAAMTSPTPQTGSAIADLSSSVSDMRLDGSRNNSVIDMSKNHGVVSQPREMSKSIPSPVADRGSIDKFNFFMPLGEMK